jgi:hypothetical protein
MVVENNYSGSEDWTKDAELLEFLEQIDNTGPWSEEEDKINTIGGLTNDKEKSFIKFLNKLDKKNKNE